MTADSQAALHSTLIELEKQFWRASASRDGAFYRRRCTPNALFVFPFTVMELPAYSEALEAINDPWHGCQLQDVRLVRLTENSATLLYLATANRLSGRHTYRSFITSVYVQRRNTWLLTHQQHTPIA